MLRGARVRMNPWPRLTWVRTDSTDLRRIVLLTAAMLLCLVSFAAPGASANSAQITKAHANPSWTRASFAGSVTWDACVPAEPCSWAVFATVYPSKFDECGRPGQFSEYVVTIPIGQPQSANGTVSVNESNVKTLAGIYGQLLCFWAVTNPESLPPDCLGPSGSSADCAMDYQMSRKPLSGRNPCKKKKSSKKRIARKADRLLTVPQYRDKWCPKRKRK